MSIMTTREANNGLHDSVGSHWRRVYYHSSLLRAIKDSGACLALFRN